MLNEQGEAYHTQTHVSGFYRKIFKKLKDMFERIFMTGVSPVTLDDLTNGFNIGWNISTKHQFNMMFGLFRYLCFVSPLLCKLFLCVISLLSTTKHSISVQFSVIWAPI